MSIPFPGTWSSSILQIILGGLSSAYFRESLKFSKFFFTCLRVLQLLINLSHKVVRLWNIRADGNRRDEFSFRFFKLPLPPVTFPAKQMDPKRISLPAFRDFQIPQRVFVFAIPHRNIAQIKIGQRIVGTFLESAEKFLFCEGNLMLRPIGNSDGEVNSRGLRALRQCGLVLLEGIEISFRIRVEFALKDVQLERVWIESSQPVNRLERRILVDARQLVECICVLRIIA